MPVDPRIELMKQEHSMLRQELHYLKDCQFKFLALSVTATGVLLSLVAKFNMPEYRALAFLAPLLILIPCSLIFFDKATTITRIVGYYRLLEQAILGLKTVGKYEGWENALREFRKKQQEDARTRKKRPRPIRRIVVYCKLLRKAILGLKTVRKYKDWENALEKCHGKQRKHTPTRKTQKPPRGDPTLFEILTLRTSHPYWVFVYCAFVLLCCVCLFLGWSAIHEEPGMQPNESPTVKVICYGLGYCAVHEKPCLQADSNCHARVNEQWIPMAKWLALPFFLLLLLASQLWNLRVVYQLISGRSSYNVNEDLWCTILDAKDAEKPKPSPPRGDGAGNVCTDT